MNNQCIWIDFPLGYQSTDPTLRTPINMFSTAQTNAAVLIQSVRMLPLIYFYPVQLTAYWLNSTRPHLFFARPSTLRSYCVEKVKERSEKVRASNISRDQFGLKCNWLTKFRTMNLNAKFNENPLISKGTEALFRIEHWINKTHYQTDVWPVLLLVMISQWKQSVCY
jgi:hypothetical protein